MLLSNIVSLARIFNTIINKIEYSFFTFPGGKRDEELILPINDSLSGTLSTDQMCAKTTIAASPQFKENKIWLNGKEETFDNPRLLNCLKERKLFMNDIDTPTYFTLQTIVTDDLILILVKKRAKTMSNNVTNEMVDWNIHVCSENNFPTAAGLASSAAGYACFVYTLASLYKIEGSEISSIARQGSGSACRSIFGGFVQWNMGELVDGSDSVAVQVVPSTHWKEMHVLILVVNDAKKKTSSTGGMSRSVRTSDLLKYRAERCVPDRMDEIREAIESRNFTKFAEITMKDSNQFHAVCLDTYPPCVYMNDVSHAIVNLVHQFNAAHGDVRVAYTFDAGPNACLYLLETEVPKIVSLINQVFPNDDGKNVEYIKGIPVDLENVYTDDEVLNKIYREPVGRNLLKYIIHTKIGEGPKQLDSIESLLNENGFPK